MSTDSTMQLVMYQDGELKLSVPILAKGKVGSWWETPAGIYLLATSIPLSRGMSLLVAAVSSLGAAILGPAVLTVEYEPVPRGFAIGLIFLSIGLAAHGRMMLATTSAAIAFLYHAPTAIPVCAETVALSTILLLARETGARIHLCRMSSAEGVDMVRQAKQRGCEPDVTPCQRRSTSAIAVIPSRGRIADSWKGRQC